MENDTQKFIDSQNLLDAKTHEVRIINDIIKNMKELESTYSSGSLKNDRELYIITNHLKDWKSRKTSVEEQLENLHNEEDPDAVVREIAKVSNYIGSFLDDIEDKKNQVTNHVYPNSTKKEWLETIEFIAAKSGSGTLPRKQDIFVDDDIIKKSAGFMCGPVGLFNGKPVEAGRPIEFDSLENLKDWVEEKSSNHDMVVYMTYEENGKFYWRGALVTN
jgi:hypothetical protein